ncbi:MAG: carbohydrate kinase [Flavobacterium sp.]|nr:carbohydrate kinase [Flavobacterium sp.]
MTKSAVCFGEVLWDVLPTESIAGGAPMNVAIRLQSLGVPTKIISKIGKDKLGEELMAILHEKQVSTDLIQVDEQQSTGEVLVTLDNKGSASYEIVFPTAWDEIELTADNQKAVSESDVFVFGSLACRNEVSKNTLFSLLELAKYKVFDVNIRPPFYTLSLLEDLMNKADFIKLNDDELLEVAQKLGSQTEDIEANILFLAKRTNTQTICITKGKHGAVLWANNQFYAGKGFSVEVADTIGAGDSFLAALMSKIIVSTNYYEAVTFACGVGALVAGYKGANPQISSEEINDFISKQA